MSSRHPSTLVPLCLIEGAERFAASLLGAVLIFHLAEDVHLRPGQAAELQALYLSLSYALSIIGGLIADRLTGYRRALALGLLLLGAGYSLLSLPGRFTLFSGLGLLVLGQALFKPTINAVLGSIYVNRPELRAAGFAWFYVAINIAAALAPWVGTVLRHRAGWSGAMVAATWSGAVGLGVLFMVVANLPEPVKAPMGQEPGDSDGKPSSSRARWLELVLPLIVVMCFSIAASQAQGTLLFFARDRLLRSIGGKELPAEVFAALPAMLVIMLKPVLDALHRLGVRHGQRLSGQAQLTLGLLLTSGAFVLLAGVTMLSPLAKVSPVWLLTSEAILMMGELLVMPGAMALVAERMPREQGALSQGILFGVQALGFGFSGLVGSLWGRMPEAWFLGMVAGMPMIPLFFYAVARRWLWSNSSGQCV